jgi:hypothetical protein
MKLTFISITTACLFFLLGCASTSSSIYNKEGIARIKTWEITFSYESGEIEQSISPQGESSARVMKTGLPPSDLQLRDDIFFRLKDKFNVLVTNDPAQASGQIRLHAVHFNSGGFKSVDVSLYDKGQQLLARVRVKNGDRNGTFKEDDSFAEYASDAIAELLRSH